MKKTIAQIKEAIEAQISELVTEGAVFACVAQMVEEKKHFKQFGKRQLDALKEILIRQLGDDWSVNHSSFGHYGVKIYRHAPGKSCGNGWDISGYGEMWQAVFEKELKVRDNTDSIQRLRQSITVLARLEGIEKQIESLQAEASNIFKDMPLPEAAKNGVRAQAHFWNTPGSIVREGFPACFPKS